MLIATGATRATHIRVSANGLNDILFKGVLKTSKGIIGEWELRSLSELAVLAVNILHPVVMGCSRS